MVSESILKALRLNFKNFAILKVAVNPENPELLSQYKSYVDEYNKQIFVDPFPNSGFDLFFPNKVEFASINTKMASMDIKCEMVNQDGVSCGYYMYPRSSISKTPLMLANHTGIIDSGYRGFLIGAFRNLLQQSYTVEKYTRLLQICHPSLFPIHVVLVDENQLSGHREVKGGLDQRVYKAQV